jgi:hypothetical protein
MEFPRQISDHALGMGICSPDLVARADPVERLFASSEKKKRLGTPDGQRKP